MVQFPGETNLDSLMTTLITAVDDHNLNIEREAMEEVSRSDTYMIVYMYLCFNSREECNVIFVSIYTCRCSSVTFYFVNECYC